MSEDSNTLIAMVALNSTALPSASNTLTTLCELRPNFKVSDDVDDKDGAIVFDFDGNMAAIGLIPAPMPWSDLEGPCATAWWWEEATEKMQAHTAHAIVSLMGDSGDAVQRHIDLSQLVAAVAANTDAAGIYWGNGTVVHETATFQEQAAALSPDVIDVHLWIDMRLERINDKSFRFFTTGMTSFDQLEVEIDSVTLDPDEILDFCYSIIDYIIMSGVTIKPGETIGRTAEEKIKVSHGDSMWDREGKVMKLTFP